MRTVLFTLLLLGHALLIAFAPYLPDTLAAAIAGSVYLPLWPLSALGLPVYTQAEAWGWSNPSRLGWGLLVVVWSAVWTVVVAGLTRHCR